MPPTSDLLNITSEEKRFPDLIESSSLSPLLFILRPLFFFFIAPTQLVIILTSIVSAFDFLRQENSTVLHCTFRA